MLTVIGGVIEGENLYVTLQSNSVEEITSASARQLAYKERFKFGFANAGVEINGGPYPIDLSKKNPDTPEHDGMPVPISGMSEISKRTKDLAYRQVYRLQRSVF